MKRAIVACLLGVCVLVPSAADARPKKIPSTVTATFTDKEPALPIPVVFADDPDTFSGKVSSEHAKCVADRDIKVIKKNAEDKVLGIAAVAKTKADGSWTTNKEDPTPGRYFAVATRKQVSGEGRKKICVAAESNEMTVE